MASTETTEDTNPCHLLRIPKELRFIIYRHLLFPTTLIPMIPLTPLHDTLDGSDDSEEEWTDEDSEYPNTEDEFDEMFSEGREYISAAEARFATNQQYATLKRYPAILRTNRQIYSEASSLLYTEAILVVEPGDIFCLRKRPRDLPFGARNPCPWRHNPLKGKRTVVDGIVKYETPLLEGHMEPHVFARFQKIYFSALFDFEHTQHVEMWIDDDTHIIPEEDILAYHRVLNSSHVMKDFVKLLSRSPRITKLEICLEVEIMATSELLLEGMAEDDEDDDEALAKEEKADRLMDIASEKATELFLDSKICDPLLKLSNVQTFNLKFGFEMRDEDEVYDPPRKYLDLFQGMKTQIEGNFKEPRNSRTNSAHYKL